MEMSECSPLDSLAILGYVRVLPVVPLVILPMAPLVAIGTVDDQRTLKSVESQWYHW